MEIQITFQDGPVEAKIESSEEEDYSEVLDQLAKFVDGYDYNEGQSGSAVLPNSAADSVQKTAENESGKSNTYFDKVDATDTEIQRVLKLGKVEDDDIQEFPKIVSDPSVLAGSKHRRLLNGVVVILAILNDVHGISSVKTSDLKDALGDSGLPVDSWGNINKADNESVYITRRGSGASATTEIRDPGKEDAYKYIQSLIDDLRADDAE